MKISILVVEDEDEAALILYNLLNDEGYSVYTASSAQSAKNAIKNGEFDLVLLDLNLSSVTRSKLLSGAGLVDDNLIGQEGFEIAAWLRDNYPNIRLIFLTSRNDVTNSVRGLDLGAADYITKPFNASILKARIRSTLRRSGKSTSPFIVFRDWKFDTKLRQISHLGAPDLAPINLSSAESIILLSLLDANEETVSRESLSKRAFGRPLTSHDRAVDTSISKLRAKLNDERKSANQIIETMHGSGYRIVRK